MIFDPKFQSAITTAASQRRAPRTPPVNPRPRGHIEPAGATAQLLRVLADQSHRFCSHREIYKAMTEPKALSWSLRYARQMGWISSAEDPRCRRYRRHQITALGLKFFD